MNDERWATVDRSVGAALERAPHERAAFLREACADDEPLRREVESLLAHASRCGGLSEHACDSPGNAPGDVASFVGRQMGSYAIQAQLGVGGMGEVYRARDGKLGRDVAIKILPRVFSTDPDRRARFDREARLLAALNHPHIGAIYGVEDSDGVRALVLELVEGDTLADRIAQGRPRGQRGPPHRAADRRRARGGAREGHHSPRSETRQHQDHAGWRRQGPRLRPGEGGERRCLAARI